MFEVLEFLYDSYWSLAQCPTLATLHRTLNAQGFRSDSVLNALVWLEELQDAAQRVGDAQQRALPPRLVASSRVLTDAERRKIGVDGWGLLTKLASAGSLPWDQLELVIDRAMATPGHTLDTDQLKLIIWLVFWSLKQPAEDVFAEALLDNSTAHAVH